MGHMFAGWVSRRTMTLQLLMIQILWNIIIPFVGLGEPCRYNENCVLPGNKLAVCFGGKCQCNRNMKPASGPGGDYCIPAANLGEECHNNLTCKPINSQCMKICRCKEGYTASLDESSCLKSKFMDLLSEFC